MTLSDLVKLAWKNGFMLDEKANIAYDGYCFIGVLDHGYSSQRISFDSIADAARYFNKES